MRRSIIALGLIGSVWLVAGCTTAPSTAPRSAGGANSGASIKLAKGMTADAVRLQLGKPAELSMIVTAEGLAEEWTYHLTFQRSTEVATSMRDVPAYLGPGVGGAQGMGTVQEPVYSLEFREVHETIKLLMFQGRLLEWKSTSTEKRTYH